MAEQVFVYPSDDRYERWEKEAEDQGTSLSKFVQNMVEAGLKNFTRPDSQAELEQLKETQESLCFDPVELNQLVKEYRTCSTAERRAEIEEGIQEMTYGSPTKALDGTPLDEMGDEDLFRTYLEAAQKEYYSELSVLREKLNERGISHNLRPEHARSVLEECGIDAFRGE